MNIQCKNAEDDHKREVEDVGDAERKAQYYADDASPEVI